MPDPSGRWRRVEELCHAALARDASERSAFLSAECGDDHGLRREVDALLAHEKSAEGFLEGPVGAVAANVMNERAASLVGRRIGPYEIVSPLGAGGMGEVYRARDTQLGRDVAIKVLPPAFVADRERLARFEREARVLASLNHPHIAAIYGVEPFDGARALILELVEGETLAGRIAKGSGWRAEGVPMTEALQVARQLAVALDAAHEKGIVHRDLKPANIKITPSGTVKVLDFGLAKAGVGAPGADLSHSPTFTGTGTHEGVLMGTAAYMSPEQAAGKPVDKRSDLWAFGVVVLEMLTGRPVFTGETVSHVIASVLTSEPDWTSLPASTPPLIRRLLRRCLEKDRQRRLDSAAVARLEIEEALTAPSGTDMAAATPAPAKRSVWFRVMPWAVAGMFGVAVGAGLAVWSLMRPRAAGMDTVTKSVIALPRGTRLDAFSSLAFSPDARTTVFAAEDGGRRLYVRPLDSLVAMPVTGTDGAADPFFSPDGRWVGFWSDNKIKKVALSGGAPQVICDAAGIGVIAPVWGDDDTIVFAATSGAGLLQVSANGGTPHVLTTPNRGEREKTHRLPDVLPGGKAVIMTVGTADITTFDDARIEAVTLATGQRKVLIRGGMNARYVSTGHLVYARSGSLLAVPFDINRLEVTGPPVALVDEVLTDHRTGIANFAISRDGSLLYAPGGAAKGVSALLWVDRQGRSEPATVERRPFVNPRLSPDGQRVAVTTDDATSEIWVYDLNRTTATRLVHGWDNGNAVWSPDGARLAFNSNSGTSGGRNLFVQAADGTGVAERLTPDSLVFQSADAWSPDGRFLVFTQNDPATKADLWIMSVAERKPRPLIQTPASEANAKISPDGRWIAYQSDQSGRFEVYVQAFPRPSRNWQVSPDGGSFPVWARNGRELFYRNAGWMMAADVTAASDFSASKPRQLFDASQLGKWWFDVASDGRFLVIKNDERPPITQLNLVQNWTEELKARVPRR